MYAANGFPPIRAAFYSVFDPEQGSKVVAQVPADAVLAQDPLVAFDAIKNYIIPKPPLCNQIVGILYKGYRVVGHPVHLVSTHYERNSFTFNFSFVFDADAEIGPYENVISRTANMFRALEEQSHYLSDAGNLRALQSALDQMFQDLNNFSECQIPIDDSNKLDIKLFPILEEPPAIHGFHVPVLTVELARLVDESWNPALERIVQYIDGCNSVRRIADLAEADYDLTKRGIQHLVHYGCVVVIDVFQFSNVYAPTSTVADICDPGVFEEFSEYVYTAKPLPGPFARSMSVVEPVRLSMRLALKLYTSFNSGQPLSVWCVQHKELLADVDLVKLLEFGVLKRLIYMVHSYPLFLPRRDRPSQQRVELALEKHGLDPHCAEWVFKCMDSAVHLEALCTELRASKTTAVNVLKDVGDWVIANK